MINLFPLAVLGGTAIAIAAKQYKRPRLIDALNPSTPHKPSRLGYLHQLPFIKREQLHQILALMISSAPRSEAERDAFNAFKKMTFGVGLGVAGLFFAPLQIVGLVYVMPTMAYFFKGAYQSLVHERRINADVLTTVFLGGALVGGFFFELIMGGWFVVLINWLALKTEDHSKQGIIDLFGQQIRSVWMLVDGTEIEVPIEHVKVGDLIVIYAGQMAPMDGIIVDGYASIDQHMLTGEAQPAEKGPGDRVLAATIVLSGQISVQVSKAGDETVAAQIGHALTDTSDFKENLVSRSVAFNDRMALPILLLGGLSFPFLGLNHTLSILMGAPGYRMVLYGPLSMLSYLHLACRQGILIKDGRSLELLRDIDTVLFDKTGTLTLEQPHVSGIHAYHGFSEHEVLTYAAAAEAKQNHPIARAILEAAAAQKIEPAPIADAEYEIGYGIQVKLDGKTIYVGSQRFIQMQGIVILPVIQALQTDAHNAGHSLVLVAVDDTVAGAIVLQPTLRPEAKTIVDHLRARGLRLYIVSGDHDAPTRHLAEQLEMDGYFAEVLPEDKADLVRQLQINGRNVCFVGDGINDSIALKSANVSVSLQGATTIAIDTAQIVLMNGDLAQLPSLFTLADEFATNMRVNSYAATLPCIVIIGGALFLGWGLLPAVVLLQVSVPFALYNTIRPLLTQDYSLLPSTQAPIEIEASE